MKTIGHGNGLVLNEIRAAFRRWNAARQKGEMEEKRLRRVARFAPPGIAEWLEAG